jgi:hypothetical protein
MSDRKIAVCISGQIRTAIEAFKSFQNFFSDEDIDVFIHTWNIDDSQKIDEIIKLYKPKYIQIDKSPNYKRLDFDLMFKTIFLSNRLKRKYEIENDFRYDVVVKYRFDLIFSKEEKFPKSIIEEKKIYVSKIDGPKMNTDYEQYGIHDLFFWGDSHSMDIMSLTYKIKSLYYGNIRKKYFDKTDYIANNTLSESMISPDHSLFKQAYRYGLVLEPVLNNKNGPLLNTIFRDDVSHLDPFDNFNEIAYFYHNQYNNEK